VVDVNVIPRVVRRTQTLCRHLLNYPFGQILNIFCRESEFERRRHQRVNKADNVRHRHQRVRAGNLCRRHQRVCLGFLCTAGIGLWGGGFVFECRRHQRVNKAGNVRHRHQRVRTVHHAFTLVRLSENISDHYR